MAIGSVSAPFYSTLANDPEGRSSTPPRVDFNENGYNITGPTDADGTPPLGENNLPEMSFHTNYAVSLDSSNSPRYFVYSKNKDQFEANALDMGHDDEADVTGIFSDIEKLKIMKPMLGYVDIMKEVSDDDEKTGRQKAIVLWTFMKNALKDRGFPDDVVKNFPEYLVVGLM